MSSQVFHSARQFTFFQFVWTEEGDSAGLAGSFQLPFSCHSVSFPAIVCAF